MSEHSLWALLRLLRAIPSFYEDITRYTVPTILSLVHCD